MWVKSIIKVKKDLNPAENQKLSLQKNVNNYNTMGTSAYGNSYQCEQNKNNEKINSEKEKEEKISFFKSLYQKVITVFEWYMK